MTSPIPCWCGNSDLIPFSPQYQRCAACETLVTLERAAGDIARVGPEEDGFYGRDYWFSHQQEDLGFPHVVDRARLDLPERCLHWLRAALAYKLPPGRALEIGSAHGGFVALLKWAGFEAEGLELSSWVVEFARRSFEVPMLLGPLERQSLPRGAFDIIALLDVFEHLQDPKGTLRLCLDLLKPDGALVIQTPQYAEGRTHEEMVATRDAFLQQLKANEHLYLFSRPSVRRFFAELGAAHVEFLPAIFAQYDMFFVVSRLPLHRTTAAETEHALSASPGGRMIQALLDLEDSRSQSRGERAALREQLDVSEADRAARLDTIHRLDEALTISQAVLNKRPVRVLRWLKIV